MTSSSARKLNKYNSKTQMFISENLTDFPTPSSKKQIKKKKKIETQTWREEFHNKLLSKIGSFLFIV